MHGTGRPPPPKWCTGAIDGTPSVDRYAARFFFASSGAGNDMGGSEHGADQVGNVYRRYS